jgi:AraC-like DNA-binding protein
MSGPLIEHDALPLGGHVFFTSSDLDETRDLVGRVFKPHRLNITERGAQLRARKHHVKIGGLSLNLLRYGAPVAIDPGPLETFFLVQMPLAGRAEIRCGKEEFVSTPAVASLPSPTLDLAMRWGGDNPQVIVRLERDALERHLAAALGRELDRPLEFRAAMAMDQGGGASWRRLVDYLIGEIDAGGALLGSRLAATQVEQLLMTALLTLQPHNYMEALGRGVSPAAPYYVRRAEEFMATNADKPITMTALAEAAGASARALQEGFRRFRDTTPMAHLKGLRLARVRADLETADPARDSVTEIATRWGFFHLGNFAADYRRRFGERPSETLKRAAGRPAEGRR